MNKQRSSRSIGIIGHSVELSSSVSGCRAVSAGSTRDHSCSVQWCTYVCILCIICL